MGAAHDIDRVFNALGDPTRRAMVARISEGPISVTDLAKPFKMSLAAVVQHLQLLEESGLVETQKVGRVRTCAIQPRALDLASRWIASRKSLWEKRLDRLGAMLDEE